MQFIFIEHLSYEEAQCAVRGVKWKGREYIMEAECNVIPRNTKKQNEGQGEHKVAPGRKERCNSI